MLPACVVQIYKHKNGAGGQTRGLKYDHVKKKEAKLSYLCACRSMFT